MSEHLVELPGADPRYRYYVAIYRCDVATGKPVVIVCGNAKLEIFQERRTYFPSEYRPAVIAAVEGAEYCFPTLSPVALDSKSRHLVITSRTKLDRGEAQATCEAELDRVVALVSAISSPDLFRTLLFRGWLRGGPATRDLGALMKAVSPIEVDKSISRDYSVAFSAVSRQAVLRDRFSLMSRFVTKGLAEPPGEEAFVWLWTALEVFPMVGTTDIKPISSFLSGYLGVSGEIVKEKLNIGWLFGMRSRLVHDGHLPLERDAKFSALQNLELVVNAVIRHAAGLPYNGSLDSFLGRQ